MLLLSLLPFAICLLEAPGDGEQERARPRVPSDAATLPAQPNPAPLSVPFTPQLLARRDGHPNPPFLLIKQTPAMRLRLCAVALVMVRSHASGAAFSIVCPLHFIYAQIIIFRTGKK